MAVHVRAMLELRRRGAVTFDYGNNIRAQAEKAGVADAFQIPGFVPEYIRPLFCVGKGPFRWAALSGDPADIHATDDLALEMFAHDAALCRWIRFARERIAFQGLPARIFWLGYGERARFGLALNDLVRRGKVQAPIVIGRDHLDTGSVASPHRETEGMKDGSDAIADWPVLNALLNTSSGATWVSVHHGGGVGIGYSLHAGMVIVADGSREADEKLQRVLTCDPGLGVVRHADAGYADAIDTARRSSIDMPMFGHTRLPRRKGRTDDDPRAPRTRTPTPHRARRLNGCWPPYSRRPWRMRDRPHLAAAAAARSHRTLHQSVRRRRTRGYDAGAIPQHATRGVAIPRPSIRYARTRPKGRARDAFDATLAFLDTARAAGDAPATFLLDEFLELRTFESFPGLRTVLRDLISALASSGNRFVLTTRYTARAHRLLRDMPAPFEIIHVAPLSAAEVRATLPAGEMRGGTFKEDEDDHARDELARIVQVLADGRPAYSRLIAETASAIAPRGGADPVSALAALIAPGGQLTAACHYSYELRLHRARGYGALKAILEVLAEHEPLTLTEIALRLRRTPGSTKDYLSWLEDVDLIVSRQKRYSFADPMMRLWVRLHCRPTPPNDEDVAREVHSYVMARLPQAEPALALAGSTAGDAEREKSWGIIEID